MIWSPIWALPAASVYTFKFSSANRKYRFRSEENLFCRDPISPDVQPQYTSSLASLYYVTSVERADPFVWGWACRSFGGRAILPPSAAHRAAVAHCPHWFQLAGGATAEPGAAQGGAFRSCQQRLSARLHKLTCMNWRARAPPTPTHTHTNTHTPTLTPSQTNEGIMSCWEMHDNWQYICLSFCWTLGHLKKKNNKTQLTNYKSVTWLNVNVSLCRGAHAVAARASVSVGESN